MRTSTDTILNPGGILPAGSSHRTSICALIVRSVVIVSKPPLPRVTFPFAGTSAFTYSLPRTTTSMVPVWPYGADGDVRGEVDGLGAAVGVRVGVGARVGVAVGGGVAIGAAVGAAVGGAVGAAVGAAVERPVAGNEVSVWVATGVGAGGAAGLAAWRTKKPPPSNDRVTMKAATRSPAWRMAVSAYSTR